MKTASIYAKYAATLGLGMLIGIAALFAWQKSIHAKVHVLAAPMIISGDPSSAIYSLLPAGTTLYLDRSFPEGFTRYKVYLNVDRFPLDLSPLRDPTEIAPIEARPIEKADLSRLLQAYPLTKIELQLILKSASMDRGELRSVLSDYLREHPSENP